MKAEFDAVSLFSGCGGSDLGLKQAGVQAVWANDASESACELYKAVTGDKETIRLGDIAKTNDYPRAELLVGCYPCQGYSQGGRRNEEDKINYLYQQFDRALRKIRPRAFIVENVDGMRHSQNQHLLRAQIIRFRLAGYRVVWNRLNAMDFGLAQNRKRVFIVGIQTSEAKEFVFPEPTHGPDRPSPHATLRDAIWNLRLAPDGSYNPEPLHWYYLSRDRRRSWEEQSPCIVANWRHVGLHPDSPPLVKVGKDIWKFENDGFARRYSYLECATLQGFSNPADFNVRTVEERFRAIGNAVPPPLFAAVAKQLVATLSAPTRGARGRRIVPPA